MSDWYRLKQALSIFEASALAHGEDPEAVFNDAWLAIDRQIRANTVEVARLMSASPTLYFGEVGDTILKLMVLTGASCISTPFDHVTINRWLMSIGRSLPWQVEGSVEGERHSVIAAQAARLRIDITASRLPNGARSRLCGACVQSRPDLFPQSSDDGEPATFKHAWDSMRR